MLPKASALGYTIELDTLSSELFGEKTVCILRWFGVEVAALDQFTEAREKTLADARPLARGDDAFPQQLTLKIVFTGFVLRTCRSRALAEITSRLSNQTLRNGLRGAHSVIIDL